MNIPRRQKIATRIGSQLQRELGQGVDVARMLAEPLYERDVLLVCDTYVGRELAALSQAYRSASKAPAEREREPAGFSASRFLSSLFGPLSGFDHSQPGPPQPKARGWFGRSRSTEDGK